MMLVPTWSGQGSRDCGLQLFNARGVEEFATSKALKRAFIFDCGESSTRRAWFLCMVHGFSLCCVDARADGWLASWPGCEKPHISGASRKRIGTARAAMRQWFRVSGCDHSTHPRSPPLCPICNQTPQSRVPGRCARSENFRGLGGSGKNNFGCRGAGRFCLWRGYCRRPACMADSSPQGLDKLMYFTTPMRTGGLLLLTQHTLK